MHTIITALLNADPIIERTAETLLPQLNKEVFWIIKNSNTQENKILKTIEKHPQVKIIYENDNSLYEGLNQALKHCHDGFFQVVGAGDKFKEGAIEKILYAQKKYPSIDSILFPIIQEKNGRLINPVPNEMNTRMACPHPGSLLNVTKVNSLGGFNESYKIASDYDLLSRYFIKYTKFAVSEEVIIEYMGNGISEKFAIEAFLEEE